MTLWNVTLWIAFGIFLMKQIPCEWYPFGFLMSGFPYVPYGTAALCYLMGYFPFAPYDTAAHCDPYETVFLMSLW
jgi:hypothetical protein